MGFDSLYLHILIFTLGLGLGFVAFSQIAYPLVTLIPKVRVLLRADRHPRSLLITFLLLAPAVWTVILAGTVLLVRRYLPMQHKGYLLGLGVVLLLVLFHISKRNQDLEKDFLRRLVNCMRLSKGDGPAGKGPKRKAGSGE